MPALIFGILVLVLVLWALNAYSKADPKMLAKLLPAAGGILALGGAAFLVGWLCLGWGAMRATRVD